MKLNKMWMDGKPNQNPLGTTRANRNVVFNKELQSIINEKGNLIVDSFGTNKRVIGVIVLDNNDFVVFVKQSSSNSQIGYVDKNRTYKIIKDDDRLNFKYNNPIHGTFQRNSLGELIITYTDGVEPFRYENITNPLDFNNIGVFPDSRRPKVTTVIQDGGNLNSGAYWIILGYEKADKVSTGWIKNYNPIFITNASLIKGATDKREGSIPNIATSKQINIKVDNVDTRFSKLKVGVVFQANGVKTQFYSKSIIITGGTLTTVINTLDDATPITMDEVIIDNPKFKTVKNLTQLQNTLYIQDLVRFQEPIQQAAVNNIEFQWNSQLLDINTNPQNFTDHLYNNQIRHFQHGEVYAMYIRFEWEWGFGQWWHSPGRQASAGDKDFHSSGFKKYQATDTCKTDGTLGYWENEDEIYPNKSFYPSGNVRHIKTPSIRWMKENIYQSEALYGSGKLDVLRLKFKPGTFNLNNFKDCNGNAPISYQVGYAKRNRSNGLVAGQSIFVAGVDRASTPENIYSSLGFNANHNFNDAYLFADLSKVRTYDFESLYEKSASNINFVRSEVILQSNITINVFKQLPNFNFNNIRWSIANFTIYGSIQSPVELVKVNKSRFIINNTVLENIENTYLEDTIALDLEQVLPLPSLHLINGVEWGSFTVYTHLISLLNLKRNCYSEFFNQEIIICDEVNNPNLFGGDTYINFTCINTLGTTTQASFSSDPTQSADNNTPVNGTRVANLFISENRFNADLRYVNPGAEGNTYHHPHDPGEVYLPRLRRDQEPNLIIQAYSKDYNAQNNLEFSNIFNPNTDRNFEDKFDLRRGSPISTEGDIGSWLTFKLNDVYPLIKTRGEVVFLGASKDFLIIHHRNALFRTRARTYIDVSEGEAAFTGQGDIFQNEPEELIYDEKGALGTQHRWSCYVSRFGYFWVDSEAKKVYRYDGQITDLAINGLGNFFEENLNCNDDNPFNSFGFHIVIDEQNRRVLLTKKSLKLIGNYEKNFKGVWKSDQNFINSLQVGDIVIKDGAYVEVK